MSDLLKVALIQPRLQKSIEEALNNIDQILAGSMGVREADFVVLPESWLLLNIYETVNEHIENYHKIIEFLTDKASEIGSYIVAGALYTEEDGNKYIVSPVISPNGKIIGKQYKINLFRLENQYFTTKQEINIFEVRDVKFGIMVCYDANFPEIPRIIVKEGADIIFNPSRIIAGGEEMWHLYLATRTLENRIPIVGVNVYYPGQYNGRSIVFVPENTQLGIVVPKISEMLGKEQAISVVEIKLKAIKGMKNKRLKEVLNLEKILNSLEIKKIKI